ncbi:MAG: hypothetical protein KME29_28335 [Calothrix sp. FI2-JRJ7]|nr:hypothetical protein [Calothrix sp. FI2-JRJ7]
MRAPRLTISDRAVVLGSKLEFRLAGSDLDANTTLKDSAINLPEGATLDTTTGQFNWQPKDRRGDLKNESPQPSAPLMAERNFINFLDVPLLIIASLRLCGKKRYDCTFETDVLQLIKFNNMNH